MSQLVAKLFYWLGRSPIGQALFTILVEKLTAFVKDSIEREKKRREIIAKSKASLEALENAKTKDEIDSAINNVLDDV